jgi:hypothetical protein
MTDYDFTADMTPEQVELAYEAGKLATAHVKGVKLYEGLKIGESLLIGREVAMRLAGVNAPTGRAYSDHLLRWKLRFGFPTDAAFNSFCDAAIYCAQHRDDANAVIASLLPRQRAELGIQGLVKRVRERVREARGEPHKPPKPSPLTAMKARLADAEGELADAKERLANADEGSLYVHKKTPPDQIARTILENYGLGYTKNVRNALTQAITAAEGKLRDKPKAAG